MPLDLSKLETLVADKNYAAAKTLIKEGIAKGLTTEEKGALLVNFASVYMEVMNSVSKQYKSALEDAINGIKKLNKAESSTGDKLRLEELRTELNS